MSSRPLILTVLSHLLVCMVLTPCCFGNKNADILKFDPPVQSYAVIDISGDKTSDVDLVALNDDNRTAFGFGSGGTGENRDFDQYHAYTWQNGILSNEQVTDLLVDEGVDEYGAEVWLSEFVSTLLSNGSICGSGTEYAGDICTDEFMFGVSSADLPAPFDQPDDELLNGPSLGRVSENGTFICFANITTSYPTAFHPVNFLHTIDGKWTIFPNGYDFDHTKVPAGTSIEPDVFFSPNNVNSNGWFSATQGNAAVIWEGISPLNTTHGANDLNDQNQAVNGDFWENNSSTILQNELPIWLQGQYWNISAFSIGNQVKAAPAPPLLPDPSSDATIHLLTTAQGLDVGAYGTMLWTRDNNGKWSFANVALPAGTSITDWTSINSSGVIAAIGNGGHALLLVPATGVEIYKSITSADVQWQDENFIQTWSDPINDSDDLKFRVKFPLTLPSLDHVKYEPGVALYRRGHEPTWKHVKLDSGDRLSPDSREIWMTISNGFLWDNFSEEEDSAQTPTFSSYESSGSANFNDSLMFESHLSDSTNSKPDVAAWSLGNWSQDPQPIPVKGVIPPWSGSGGSDTFLIGGGTNYIEIQEPPVIDYPSSNKRMFRKQSKWFYYSGHGYHDIGTIGNSCSASNVQWSEGMEDVFIAGCSILDVNNYNDNKHSDGSPAANNSPGKAWSITGPKHFMGYNWTAPADDQGYDTNFTAGIIDSCLDFIDDGESPEVAWMKANSLAVIAGRNYGQNACAISTPSGTGSRTYYYFEHSKFFGPTLVTVPESKW